MTLLQLLRASVLRRKPLRDDPVTTCFRLVNGEADGLSGWTLDWFDGVCALSFYDDVANEQALFDAVEEVVAPRALYVKRRPKEARVVATVRKDDLAPEAPERGEAVDSLVVLEGGQRYRIRPGQGLSLGLYLDMREPRAWLRANVQGKTVLNTFAYTCAFGVCALSGGAARAVNLDLSRRVLDWGAENTTLNGHSVNPRDFIAGDVFDWLRRFKKKGERFDVVILDPPSFSTANKKVFSAATHYSSLVAAAAPLVSPGGTLLTCCNLAQLSSRDFSGLVTKGLVLASRNATETESLGPSTVDFPGSPLKVSRLRLA
ncbi:MAG: class I SAM-dependent rRNA methyltransferase [Myxococcaceae bacterium]